MSTVIESRESHVVLTDTTARVYIRILDDGVLVDPSAMSLRVVTRSGVVLYEDDYFTPPTIPGVTRIVREATGIYYFPLGDQTLYPLSDGRTNIETSYSNMLVLAWAVVTPESQGTRPVIQFVRVITPRTATWVSALRVIIDKAAKLVDENPDDPFYVGYTDAMLVQFLEGGLAWINGFQPYPTWATIDDFPDLHWRILLDGAVCDALTQQELYAVDVDINYCLVEGSQVSLASGARKPIEDIRVGDRVLDRLGQPQQVSAAWCAGSPDKLVALTLWGGHKIECTDNHAWPVWAWARTCGCGCGQEMRPGKVFARGHQTRVPDRNVIHVRGGVSTACPTRQSILSTYEPRQRMAAKDIRPGDFLMIPRRFHESPTDVTPDEARMLGYYAAEGHPTHLAGDSAGAYRSLCFTFGEHEADTWIADIGRFADAHRFNLWVMKDPNAAAFYVRMKNDYGRATEVLRLAALAEAHVGEGSRAKCLSEAVMQWPLAQKREFITGLLRGDGHQSWQHGSGNSFAVYYSTASEQLVGQVQLMLAQLGFPSQRIIEKAKITAIRGVTVTSQGGYKLRVPNPYATELADLVWGRASKAHEYAAQARVGWSAPRPECMVDDDFIYIPVKAVHEVANTRRVFNLTVDGDHSFMVDGLATYNSDQGNVFVIEHQPKLSAILSSTWQRLEKTVPPMKRQYVMSGAIHMQTAPNFRLAQLLQAAPPGSTFRNAFTT